MGSTTHHQKGSLTFRELKGGGHMTNIIYNIPSRLNIYGIEFIVINVERSCLVGLMLSI